MPEEKTQAIPAAPNWGPLRSLDRKYAAIAIAQGLVATPYKYYGEDGKINRFELAKEAIAIADELLTQLEANDDQPKT